MTIYNKLVTFVSLLLIFSLGCSELNFHTLNLPNIISFDRDNQGWYVSDGGIFSYLEYGGNPDGYVSATDNTVGVWYFVAPLSFLVEVRSRYGQIIHFDLIQTATDLQYDADDITLSNGITTLTFNTAYNPKTTWTSYAVKLDELSGWKKGKTRATKEDIQAVLQNLTDLRIRGEFRAGPDQGGLDNVAIY